MTCTLHVAWDEGLVDYHFGPGLHQHPADMFPFTGLPAETGGLGAEGTAVNVALPAGTGDASWLRAVHAIVPLLLRQFRPQILVSQHGADTHRLDPLAQLELSIDAVQDPGTIPGGTGATRRSAMAQTPFLLPGTCESSQFAAAATASLHLVLLPHRRRIYRLVRRLVNRPGPSKPAACEAARRPQKPRRPGPQRRGASRGPFSSAQPSSS